MAVAEGRQQHPAEVLIDLEHFSIFPPTRAAPIVYDFTMKVHRGTLVALMGGSGCGKTTLMVYLTTRMRDAHRDWGVTATKDVHPKRVEFVAQKEMFFPFDTPARHLLFIRQRRFSEDFAKSMEVVKETLRLVGLNDEMKWYTPIGEGGRQSTLSGGERRLLTIAAALVVNPDMVILDEPTSGMDGYTALHICSQLRQIAQVRKTTFVVSIHQPSQKVLAQFDNIVRMTPPVPPFQRQSQGNVAVVIDTHNEAGGNSSAVELSSRSILPQAMHLFRLYMWRCFVRGWTNWRAGPLRLAASLAFAILCGIAWVNLDFTNGNFLRDILGACLALIGLSFAPIILNATLFAAERDVLLEEYTQFSYVALSMEMLSRFLADIFVGACAAAVLLVAAPIIGFYYIGWYFLTMWMQAWAADSFGLFISMLAAPHVAIGVIIPNVGFLSIALGTGLMQPPIANEGYIFHVTKWMSFFKYGFQALLVKELPRTTTTCTSNCLLPDGPTMLDMLHLSGSDYTVTMGFQYLMLFVFAILFRVLSTVVLQRLIAAGNRRYSYDGTGDKPAKAVLSQTQEVAAQSQLVLIGDQQALENRLDAAVRSPISSLDAMSPTTFPASTIPPEMLAGARRKAARVWKMSRVNLSPSIVDTLVQRASGFVQDPKYARRAVLDVEEFAIHPLETVAVIGPTGCGKTLFLRSLANRFGAGVKVDGPSQIFSTCTQPVCRETTVQFVDGNDTTLPNLRTIEPVKFHATLYDPRADEQTIHQNATNQLLALGIHADKHRNLAFTLSGGQLRRLSVACKTVMAPAVLLIDEPTSGLDHDAALNLGRHLRKMAKQEGVAMICTLQQPDPELLKCFDSFVFLREGRIVIRGTEAECRAHLRIPADSENWSEDGLHALSKSCETCTGDEARIPDATPPAPIDISEAKPVRVFHAPRRNIFVCIRELSYRNLLNTWGRAPIQTLMAFVIRYLLLPVLLSVLLVNIGNQDPSYFSRSGLIFVYAACTGFAGMLNGAVNFPLQRKMVEDEIEANLYTTTAYLLSSWFTIPLLEGMLGSVLGSIALKYIASLQANLGIIIAATFVSSQICDSIGYLCGLFRNLPVASGLTVLVLMPFMIGGNVIATTEQVSRIPLLYVLEVLSTVRYMYLLIFHSELVVSTGSDAAADFIYAQYGLHPDNKWYQLSTLWPVFVSYAVLMRVVCLLAYKRVVCPPCREGRQRRLTKEGNRVGVGDATV